MHSTTPLEPLGTRTRCNGQLAYVAMTPPGTRAISTGIQGQPGGQYRRLCSTEADDSGVKACLLRIHWFALWHLIMQCSYPCPREPFLHFLSFFHFFFTPFFFTFCLFSTSSSVSTSSFFSFQLLISSFQLLFFQLLFFFVSFFPRFLFLAFFSLHFFTFFFPIPPSLSIYGSSSSHARMCF